MGERLPQAEWDRLRADVLDRDGWKCGNCRSDSQLEVHHVVPLSAGGTNRHGNLVTLCQSCHLRAHNKRDRPVDPTELGSENGRWVPTVRAFRAIFESTIHPLQRAILLLLSKTGMGVGELCNLQFEDVWLSESASDTPEWHESTEPALLIRGPDRDTRGRIRRERNSSSVVPIDPELLDVLRTWRLIAPDRPDSTDAFLLGTKQNWGRPLTPRTARMVVGRAWDSSSFAETEDGSILHPLAGDGAERTFTPLTLRYFFAETFDDDGQTRRHILQGGPRPGQSYSAYEESYKRGVFTLR